MGKQMVSCWAWLALILIALEIKPSDSISLKKFLTLSSKEKVKLDEFKQRVSSDLPHDYMKEDVYLIRFLRENDFNIAASEKMLLDMLRWRDENNIDNILEEDFLDFRVDYRGYIEGCDNEGRPILSLNVGDWDIRRAVLAGKGEKLKRYTDWLYEKSVLVVRAMQADGQNVTQTTIIIDLKNFSLVSHACPKCIPIYFYLFTSLQSHYPGYIHKIVAVNTPSYALPIWDLLKDVLSPTLKEILEIFGMDRAKWQDYLFKEIQPSQVTSQFGGTRAESLDIFDLHRSKNVLRCERPFSEYDSKK